MNERDRAWKEIDLNALAHNARAIQALLPPDCEMMAVVKADAYGHGAVPVARRLEEVRSFAVACLSEGIALRQAGIQGLFSHLCVSDGRKSEDRIYTQEQLRRFYAAVDRLRRKGYDPGKLHIQASYGLLNLPPRELSQRGGRVLINGRSCPMAGRMCMDQLLVDVTGVPDVHPGTVVTLIGQDGPLRIRAEEAAEPCGTITNELLSRLGNRLEQVILF